MKTTDLYARYFTRFRGDSGFVRVVVTYHKQRKVITSPIRITSDQAERLWSEGYVKPIRNSAEYKVNLQIYDFANELIAVVTNLIETGRYKSTPGKHISRTVQYNLNAKAEKNRNKTIARTIEDEWQRDEDAHRRGYERHPLTVDELKDLIKELRESLTPEEFAALWGLPSAKDEDATK